MHPFPVGRDAERDADVSTHPLAGNGWFDAMHRLCGAGLFGRVYDSRADALDYLDDEQPAPRVDGAAATAEVARRDHGPPDPLEAFRRRAPQRRAPCHLDRVRVTPMFPMVEFR